MSDEAAARNGFNLASKSVAAATDMPISPAHPAPALPVLLLDSTLTEASLYTCNFSPFDLPRFAMSTPLPFPLPDSSPTAALTLSSLMTSVPRSSLHSFHAQFVPSLPLLDSDVPRRLHFLSLVLRLLSSLSSLSLNTHLFLSCDLPSLIPVHSIPLHTRPFLPYVLSSVIPVRSIP